MPSNVHPDIHLVPASCAKSSTEFACTTLFRVNTADISIPAALPRVNSEQGLPAMQPALLRLCSPLACRAARQARSVPSCLCNTTAVRLHQAISTTAAATTGRARHRGPTSRTSSPTPASDSAPAAKGTGPKQARIQIDLELEDVTSHELAR